MENITLQNLINGVSKQDTITFDFNGKTIEIYKSLPVSIKNGLLKVVLQQAERDDTYNDLLVNAYLDIYMVFSYVKNIDFTQEERLDALNTYDILNNAGFITAFRDALDPTELEEMTSDMYSLVYEQRNYKNSIGGVVKALIGDMPKNVAAAQDLLRNFDPQQYQQVINFATAANGGNDIFSNLGLNANSILKTLTEDINTENTPNNDNITPIG